MRLHRLGTEEERFGDLQIRPPIDHKPRDLEFALRQRFDTGRIDLAGASAAVDAMAQASQLALGGGAVSERPACLKLGRGVLQLGHRPPGLTGSGQCAAREAEPSEGSLPRDPVCRMAVDPDRSAGRLAYEDKAYSFCLLACAAEFARQPERFAREQS